MEDDKKSLFAHIFSVRIFGLRNIVLLLGALAGLVLVGHIHSPRFAVLLGIAVLCLGLVLMEITLRRRWEAEVIARLYRMNGDFDRLVRDVARNRNEMAGLKKSLSDAGDTLRRKEVPANGDAAAEERLVRALAEELSRIGAVAAPVDIVESAAPPPFMDGLRDEKDIAALTDAQMMQLVDYAVRQDMVDMFLQPIVALPQRKPRFFETLSRIRIRDGLYLPADRYVAIALRQSLLPVIDNLLLLRTLQFIRDTAAEDSGRAFFCNITSLTLNDPKFMGDLVEFIAQNRSLAPRLVFEMGQRDLAAVAPETLTVLDGLSHLGCRFSMDQVRDLSFDYAHLAARHIRFVKVEGQLLLSALRGMGGLARLRRIKSNFDRQGIDLIVEKVENEISLRDMLELEIDYGQGFLFGRPARDFLMLEGKA